MSCKSYSKDLLEGTYKKYFGRKKGVVFMRYLFTGKNLTVSDALKERTMSKLGKLEKLLPKDASVQVTYSVNKLENKIEVTIPLQKRTLRAEVTDTDMYNALDSVVDVLEKQMLKYKSRLRDRSRKDNSFKDEFKMLFTSDDTPDTDERKIEKSKKFALKPMDAEEAVMEMELLGHNFYVFRNGSSDEVNVVYKRNNGSYGLIEPEF